MATAANGAVSDGVDCATMHATVPGIYEALAAVTQTVAPWQDYFGLAWGAQPLLSDADLAEDAAIVEAARHAAMRLDGKIGTPAAKDRLYTNGGRIVRSSAAQRAQSRF